MELKATSPRKRLAQHPYDRAVTLNTGIKVSDNRREYLVLFNQLLAIHCKRGLVWDGLEFIFPGKKAVRPYGAEQAEIRRFRHHSSVPWQ